MQSERWTHGGKSDALRNLGPNFQVNYGRIQGFSRVELLEDGWAFQNKDGAYIRGFSSRESAIRAHQQYYGGE